jgi:hypothetical protein
MSPSVPTTSCRKPLNNQDNLCARALQCATGETMKELLQKLLNERRRLIEEIAALKNRSDGLAVAIQILTEEMDAVDKASRERN